MLSVDDVQEILAIPLLGVIPESQAVLQASNTGRPVIIGKKSDAGLAYRHAVSRFLEQEQPQPQVVQTETRGFFGRVLFGS